MVKYLLITDTHLGLYGDTDKWIEIVVDFFKYVVKYCHKHGINEIIHLGDFFHNRKALNTKSQHAAHRIASILGAIPNLHTRIIVGNHDCYYKNQIHPNTLELFKEYEHIEVIDEPTLHDGILMVPWGLWGTWDHIPEDTKYVFGHFAIKGFHMNDAYVCKDGIDKEEFSVMTLSGHFHTPSKQGDITYLGAPYGQTMHDAGGERGFHLFEDGELEFIRYTKAPSFIKVHTKDIGQTDLESLEGSVVKLIFDEDYGSVENQKIVDGILESNPFTFSVDFTKVSGDEEQEDLLEKDIESREELADSYIDTQTFPTNIQVGILKAMFKKLMKEAEV